MAVASPVANRNVEISRRLLGVLYRYYGPRDFTIRFWNGDEWTPDAGGASRFTVVLKHEGSLWAMLWPPTNVGYSRAYMNGDFDVEGDWLAYAYHGNRLFQASRRFTIGEKLSIARLMLKLPKRRNPAVGRGAVSLSGRKHSRDRDQQAVSYHYDYSNEQFEYVLDSHMQYTSGIFENEHDDLETAQQFKLETICRKLNLQPGERLLDVGCGWGGLIMYAARHYGVQAVGVTISKLQLEWARKRIEREGLADRCRVELCDYRDIPLDRPFDKISTVEVLEHFGAAQFPVYYRKCFELLRPHGKLLVQQITLSGERDTTTAPGFMEKYIFPDGELAPLSQTLLAAERAGLEVRSVEGFREDYGRTLGAWLENALRHREEIVAATDEANFRVMQLFYSGARYGFVTNVYNVYQMLFAKPDADGNVG